MNTITTISTDTTLLLLRQRLIEELLQLEIHETIERLNIDMYTLIEEIVEKRVNEMSAIEVLELI